MFHWWEGNFALRDSRDFVEDTPEGMFQRSLQSWPRLEWSVIYPKYPHILYLLHSHTTTSFIKPLPWVAIGSCIYWTFWKKIIPRVNPLVIPRLRIQNLPFAKRRCLIIHRFLRSSTFSPLLSFVDDVTTPDTVSSTPSFLFFFSVSKNPNSIWI